MRAAPVTVEVVEGRNLNQRLWRSTEEVQEVDKLTGQVVTRENVSQIVEVGDFLCYQDASGAWAPSAPRWRPEVGAFRSEGTGYEVIAPSTAGEFFRYFPADDDREVVFRPNGLSLLDGASQVPLRTVVPTAAGRLSAIDPMRLIYADALGDGIDIEIELTPSGFHQNVLFRKAIEFEKTAGVSLLLETEFNLDEFTGAGGRSMIVAGEAEPVPALGAVSAEATEGEISFCRGEQDTVQAVWAFGPSRVYETAGGRLEEKAVAKKRFARREGTYLQELLPSEVLANAAAKGALPLVWDFDIIQNPINTNTVWRGGRTYWVKSCTVSNATTAITLTIEPGVTVKREPGTTLAISTNAKLIAVGEPYAMITFTSAGDANCGEVVQTPNPTGRPSTLVQIYPVASTGSQIRYAKFTKAESQLLYLNQGLGSAIENSVFVIDSSLCTSAIYASFTGSVGLTVRNNLFSNGDVVVPPAFISTNSSSLFVDNNTFILALKGINYFGTGAITVRENIFSQCTDPVSGGYPQTIAANAYYPASTAELGDASRLPLAAAPFESNPLLGDFYLITSTSCRNYGPARTASAAGFSPLIASRKVSGTLPWIPRAM